MKIPKKSAILLLLCPTIMNSCSLDLVTPKSSASYLQKCSKDGNYYCSAAIYHIPKDTKNFTVLILNTDNDEINKYILTKARENNLSLQNYIVSDKAKAMIYANTFQSSRLNSGKYSTLDNKVHNIICNPDGMCDIDNLTKGFNTIQQSDMKGSVYLVTNLLPVQ